jgi:H+-translocating NAD(P) transhydrogenase subunit alpha
LIRSPSVDATRKASFRTLASDVIESEFEQEDRMTGEALINALYVFALAAFLGYLVISRVPPLLHTPLMSATNAISGISLVGSIVTAGARYNTISTILGFTAVFCSTTNVVGGFVITDRMLRMFKRKPSKDKDK